MGAANLRNNLSGNGVDGVLRRQGRRCRSYARHYFLARAARTACAAYGCELTEDSTILNIIRNPGVGTGVSYYVVLSQDFSWSLLRPAHQRCAEKRAKHPEKRAPAGKIAQENTGTFYFPGTEEAVRLPFLFPCVASGETGRIYMPGTSAASGTVLGFTVGS